MRLVIPFLSLSVALAACGENAPEPTAKSPTPKPRALEAPVQKDSGEDAELTARIKEALAAESATYEQLEVQSNAGVVVLKGRVESDEEKKRIMAAAQKVPGVKWVQNQVAVTPPPGATATQGR
jgi:hypothetical protein